MSSDGNLMSDVIDNVTAYCNEPKSQPKPAPVNSTPTVPLRTWTGNTSLAQHNTEPRPQKQQPTRPHTGPTSTTTTEYGSPTHMFVNLMKNRTPPSPVFTTTPVPCPEPARQKRRMSNASSSQSFGPAPYSAHHNAPPSANSGQRHQATVPHPVIITLLPKFTGSSATSSYHSPSPYSTTLCCSKSIFYNYLLVWIKIYIFWNIIFNNKN